MGVTRPDHGWVEAERGHYDFGTVVRTSNGRGKARRPCNARGSRVGQAAHEEALGREAAARDRGQNNGQDGKDAA